MKTLTGIFKGLAARWRSGANATSTSPQPMNRYALAYEREKKDSTRFILYRAVDMDALLVECGLQRVSADGDFKSYANKPDAAVKQESWIRAVPSLAKNDDTITYALYLCSNGPDIGERNISMARLKPGLVDKAVVEKVFKAWDKAVLPCLTPPPAPPAEPGPSPQV